MSELNTNDTMLDMFLFETSQLVEQLEQTILVSDEESCYTEAAINEIFRLMHTIKGSAAMMMFHEISNLTHTIEDLFFYLRKEKPKQINCSALSDLILDSIDFIKVELIKIRNKDEANGNASNLIVKLKRFLSNLKMNQVEQAIEKEQEVSFDHNDFSVNFIQSDPSTYRHDYKAVIFFEEGCEMENIRAYTIIHKLKDITDYYAYYPGDILDNDKSIEVIRKEGFQIYLKSNCTFEEIQLFFTQVIFLKNLELTELEEDISNIIQQLKEIPTNRNCSEVFASKELSMLQNNDSDSSITEESNIIDKKTMGLEKHSNSIITKQSIISVSIEKLDRLIDLVGEMVITEAMVIQNPDLQGLELNNFQKAARQLNKITGEIQDIVMSVRMVPLSTTFHKMNRIVRDMCRDLHKEVQLEIEGAETEVDKNIIEHISDPLMHLVRNALDHGVEVPEIRQEKGKQRKGTITLQAKNQGNDVLIIVKDDGKGLNKDSILKKAKEYNLLKKNENYMTESEIYNLILLPGFSTKENITEYSGRGVGMDVVAKNIEAIGGAISIESIPDRGTTLILKIPLTLAIIDGMNIKVGPSCYTLPTISIKESFRPRIADIIIDPDGDEMIMVRGFCYPILRLHKLFKVDTYIKDFVEGIIIMVEQDSKVICIFADELLGQQQVVVKALPEYITKQKKINGLAGCTLLGDGKISLILDIAGLLNSI